MNDLAKLLIKEGKISFRSGNLLVCDFSNNVITLTTLSTFFKILFKEHGESAKNIIKDVARRQIKATAPILVSSNLKNPDFRRKLLNLCTVFGYGEITIIDIKSSSKEVIFRIENSPSCLMFYKLFGRQKKPQNPFLEGLCLGISELIFGLSMEATELQCLMVKRGHCYISTRPSHAKSSTEYLNRYTTDIVKYISKENRLNQTSSNFIEKVAGHNMIEWNMGMFSLWKVPGFILPTTTIIFMLKELESKFGNKIDNLLFHLARIQSKQAVNLQVEKFGFKKDKKLLRSILDHSDITGFGVATNEKADFNNQTLSFDLEFGPYSTYMEKMFDNINSSDIYMEGLAAGAAEGFFGKSMITKSTKVTKNKRIAWNHLALEGDNLKEFPISDDALSIIISSIKPHNFTL